MNEIINKILKSTESFAVEGIEMIYETVCGYKVSKNSINQLQIIIENLDKIVDEEKLNYLTKSLKEKSLFKQTPEKVNELILNYYSATVLDEEEVLANDDEEEIAVVKVAPIKATASQEKVEATPKIFDSIEEYESFLKRSFGIMGCYKKDNVYYLYGRNKSVGIKGIKSYLKKDNIVYLSEKPNTEGMTLVF